MVILVTLLFLHGASLVGSIPGGPGIPENITITFLKPTSVKVSWMTSVTNVDKYDVTYKPTDASYRVVAVVAGNSEAVTLNGLKADTQYQVTVAAVFNGKKYRSRPIVFRTLEPPHTSPHQDVGAASLPGSGNPSSDGSSSDHHNSFGGTFALGGPPHLSPPNPNSFTEPEEFTNVRGVEIGIVLLVLLVWVAAIVLFFNRWGKIRMLLPYQPDYKEQLKVPGTGVCAAAQATANPTCNGNHTQSHVCPQTFHRSSAQIDVDCWAGSSRRYRPRINSAIFISNSGPGFETGEFLRRHGSSSKLCRKAQSEENIPLTDTTPKHFGLPVLSISGPSPPEEIDEHEEESFDQDDDEQNEEKLVKQNSNNTYDSFDQQSSFEQCI
ncbi:uncharacterized protein LOC123296241 [Chrysoperla carnea]|uniref:uncharacterized protein LOC123296241 n=1 Tax=Chrysoperla carnea TaxID=189513 RepID=UPI001D066108|nr:uncharacterized protein LOC123296241 [Chrysoperla carnea]